MWIDLQALRTALDANPQHVLPLPALCRRTTLYRAAPSGPSMLAVVQLQSAAAAAVGCLERAQVLTVFLPAIPLSVVPYLGWRSDGTFTALRGVRFRWAPRENLFSFAD